MSTVPSLGGPCRRVSRGCAMPDVVRMPAEPESQRLFISAKMLQSVVYS
jgi:hypothetical protein